MTTPYRPCSSSLRASLVPPTQSVGPGSGPLEVVA